LIDNILTNQLAPGPLTGIIISDISDHLPVFYIPKNNRPCKLKIKKNSYVYKQTQCFDAASIVLFTEKLQKTVWPSIESMDSEVNSSFDNFNSMFQNLYNSSFPVLTKKVKLRYNQYKPWITAGILKSIKHKNKLYKTFIMEKTLEAKQKYTKYKNKLTSTIRNSEKSYYAGRFELTKGNMHDTWKLINNILNETCGLGTKPVIKEIIHNNQVITSPSEIANHFNDFFSNIGSDLAKNIPEAQRDVSIHDTMPPHNPSTIFLMPSTSAEIIDIVNNLSNSNSTGLDGFNTKILKNIINHIAEPLSCIFNSSLQYGIFPEKLKCAKITPIHKANEKHLINNYRPISILPLFSKILEKLMYTRLAAFVDKHQILSKNQYGFREKHSTYMALLNMVDQISDQMDQKYFSIGIFLDLSKAFDTIDHKILLRKLEIYGIRGTALQWLHCYLTNRQQCVTINNEYSKNKIITCGVPQGSILGPLLFILYINDLIQSSKILRFIMFADDTNLFYSHKDLNELSRIVNLELVKVSTWLKINKLSLNINKTHFILFHFRQKTIHSPISIQIDNTNIVQVKNTKFLGVIINENLTWSDHIEITANKCSKNLGIIRKLSKTVPTRILTTLYSTLIHPYLNYCNIIWASQPTTLLEKLYRIQKKAIRIITHNKWNTHALPLFRNLNLLTIHDINKIQTGCFTYSAIHSLLPQTFSCYFQSNSSIHQHDTRSSSHLHVLNRSTTLRSFATRIRAPILWNALTPDIKDAPSLYSFKKNTNSHYLVSMFNNDYFKYIHCTIFMLIIPYILLSTLSLTQLT